MTEQEKEYKRKLVKAIHKRFIELGDPECCRDAIAVFREANDVWAHKQNALLRKDILARLRAGFDEALWKMLRESFKFDATVDFDCFMRFMEWERDPAKRFYMPRRKIIKPMCVDPMQDMFDGKISLLSLSMPPGTGKSTLGTFGLSFQMGKDPDKPNLASAHSGTLTDSFYRAVLTLITDPEYTYSEIFPYEIADKNGMNQTIDLVKHHRFSTLTCRAINASLTGATRCEGLLYADDLVSGIEEAMNPERLDNLWQKYSNDLKSRKKDGLFEKRPIFDENGDYVLGEDGMPLEEEYFTGAKEVHIATRWSVRDVIGRLENLYGDDPRCKFITCPALDEHDESNFDYEYGVGFSTRYFIDMRANLDPVSWQALFMNMPIEREGLLFPRDELRYYYKLPTDSEGNTLLPDFVLAIADTKDKGADYGVMPVVYVYGEDLYVEDFVCNNGKPESVEAEFVQRLVDHVVQQCRFESNGAGGKVADRVYAQVLELGGHTHITRKYTTSVKETRIQVNSPAIRSRMLFKSIFDHTSEYGIAMNMLVSYVLSGKNKHDDVPDALAMFIEFYESLHRNKVEIVQRPF